MNDLFKIYGLLIFCGFPMYQNSSFFYKYIYIFFTFYSRVQQIKHLNFILVFTCWYWYLYIDTDIYIPILILTYWTIFQQKNKLTASDRSHLKDINWKFYHLYFPMSMFVSYLSCKCVRKRSTFSCDYCHNLPWK